MKQKIIIMIEDEEYNSIVEVYEKMIDILETATKYDKDKHDILATLDEVDKYMLALRKSMRKVKK